MTAVARKRASYEDVLAADPRSIAEVVDGVLYTQPRPALGHALVASELTYRLIGPFRHGRGGPGGWHILVEPELHLGLEPDILVPDLAGWRTSRMPRVSNRPFETLPPDWVAEILSPSTTLDGESYRLLGVHTGESPARLEPFEAIELDIASLWLEDDDVTPSDQ